MLSNYQEKFWQQDIRRSSTILFVTVFYLGLLVITAQAQFNSGSTGADGALDLSVDRPGCPAAQTTCTIQLPASGVFNFTTINIPANKTLSFIRNASNTPAILLASGNVTILGRIDVSGGQGNSGLTRAAGLGGPGGFDGGGGGLSVSGGTSGNAGGGPGGGGAGTPTTSSGGNAGFVVYGANPHGGVSYGTKTLIPLIGGSGGGGGSSTGSRGCGGGGGGGAILIASSTTITFGPSNNLANIVSKGGDSSDRLPNSENCFWYGGGGSGGAIRIIANTITGYVALDVTGGINPQFSNASPGRVRVEAFSAGGFVPSVLPFNSPAGVYSAATPNPVTPANPPALRITSIGGVNVPVNPSNSPHGNPDVVIPRTQTNPVVVSIAGDNIPVGTFVLLILTPQSGSPTTIKANPLQGTQASSTTTAVVNLPDGLSLITVTAEFDLMTPLAGIQPMFVNGEQVKKIEVSSQLGGASEVVYVTTSGKRVKQSELNTQKR